MDTQKETDKTKTVKSGLFGPQHKCPRCGSKAIYYKREGKRVSIVHCGLCTATWKEESVQ